MRSRRRGAGGHARRSHRTGDFPAPELVELTAADGRLLANFRCGHGGRQPWTQVAEEMVRSGLIDALTGGTARGVGAFVGDKLAGVVGWDERHQPTLWFCHVLAVAHGYQGCKYGQDLKVHLSG